MPPPWQLSAAFWLWKYPPVVILTLSLIGNGLSFVVLSRDNLSKSSLSIYLRVIAVCDTVTVICGYLPPILEQWGHISIELYHESLCILRRFFMFFAGDCAVWLIAAISIDRLIVVSCPLKAKCWCSKQRAGIVVCVLTVLSGLKNCPSFFTLGLIKDRASNGTICSAKIKYRFYEVKIRPWISLVFYYMATTLIILIANSLIVYHTRKANLNRKYLSSVKNLDRPNFVDNKAGNSSKSLTKMMISITILFICLMTPTIVIWTAIGNMEVNTPEEKAIVLLLFACTDILAFLNHSLNFILYIVSGRRFRREFFAMVCPRKYQTKNGF